MAFIDSHTHLYLRGAEDLEAMSLSGIRAAVICAFLPVKPTSAVTLEDLFTWLVQAEPERQKQYGIHALPAIGVHPRCIPVEGLSRALERVEALLAERKAVAVGEVGLETGNSQERDVLAAQLAIARDRSVPVIVHTPRVDKARLLDQILPLVEKSKVDPAKVVIDHLTGELVGKVRERGLLAGLTVQPGKLTAEGVLAVVREHGADGILVDSDAAHVTADLLAVPRVARCLESAGIAPQEVARVTGGNAARLFGLDWR
jgi:predicted metal-dependent TIM-barrel fold hydrolase